MGSGVAVRLLGGVAVVRDGVEIARRGVRQRTLLALLAAQPGVRVDADLLIEAIWSRAAPKRPRDALFVQVTRLRDWLDPAAERDRYIVADGRGYRLRLAREQVDLAAFLDAAALGLAADRPALEALDDVDRALSWWRDEPFAGCVDCEALRESRAIAETRCDRLRRRQVAGLLELGRLADAAEVVSPMHRADPLDEDLVSLAIRSLADRPGDAAALYLASVRLLRDELGVDPGPGLREAYREVVGQGGAARRQRRRPSMVGRDDIVDSLVDDLTAGGRIALIEGGAGIGKSTVLRAALADADRAGGRTALGSWDDDGAPLAAWREALAELGVGVAPGASGPEVHELLTVLAKDAPVLIALDDAHRADSASVAVLRGLARLGIPPGVVVVIAARRPATPARDTSLSYGELAGGGQTRLAQLDELDRPAVLDMTGRALTHLDAAARARLAHRVWERAGGHPLHAMALLRVLAAQRDEAGAQAAAEQVPDQLRAVLEHQVDMLPTEARWTLEALAVLRPIGLAALADVLARTPLAVALALRPALLAGLVVETDGDGADPDDGGGPTTGRIEPRFDIRHELTAQAVSEAVPTLTRAHLHHARLSRLGSGADPFLRLRHTVGSAMLQPAEQLAVAHLDAGVSSYRRRALPEALDLLDAAAADVPASRVGEHAVHRGLTLAALGQLNEADEVLDAADAVPDALDDGLAVLAALGDEPLGTAIDGDPRRLARLRRVSRRALTPLLRLEVLAALLREEGALAGQLTPGLLDEATRLAATLSGGDTEAAARVRALEARALVDTPVAAHERVAVAADALARAQAVGGAASQLDATELLMSACLAAGEVPRARELRVELAREAHRRQRPRAMWVADAVDGAILLAEGRAHEADEAAERALARGRANGVGAAAPTSFLHQFMRHWFAGTLTEIAPRIALATTMRNTAAWVAAQALVLAVGGDENAARMRLGEYRDRARNPDLWFTRAAACLAAAAAFRSDDIATARHVRERLPADPHAIVCVGFGAAVLGPVTLWTGLGAWTLDDHDTARADLSAAVALADRAGLTPWAEAAGALRAALDADRPPDSLPLGLGRGPRRSG